MKFLVKLLAAILLFDSAAALAAGTISSTTIDRLQADATGRLYAHFTTAVSGGPACATSTQWMVVDGSATVGAALVASIFGWYSLGKTVSATGTGTCYGVFEIVSVMNSSN